MTNHILNGCNDIGPCPPSGSESDIKEAMREWYVPFVVFDYLCGVVLVLVAIFFIQWVPNYI